MSKIYFQPMSDLHLDGSPTIMYRNPTIDYSKVILGLAGDINEIDSNVTKSTKLVNALNDLCRVYRAVVYVPGNHEYYDGKIDTADFKIKQWMKDTGNPSNFHYLNCDHVKIDNYNFIGAALWTDFDKANPITMYTASKNMSDYRYIRRFIGDGCARITPEYILGVHHQHRKFILDKLKELKGQKNIVMTHHSPSWQSVSEGYRNDPLNGAYMNALDNHIIETSPILWQHGHVHTSHRYKIGKTTVVANPRGYSHFNTKSKKQVDLLAANLHMYSYRLDGWGQDDILTKDNDILWCDSVPLINNIVSTENPKFNYNMLLNLSSL